jgi:DNA repair ATPase RecN
MTGDPVEQKGESVTLERGRYEELLIELGRLRRTSELFAEYKSALLDKERELKEKDKALEEIKEILLEVEWKDYELEQTQKRLRELETEVERLKTNRSWWKRLLGIR